MQGLDITFGPDSYFGGILLRTIAPIDGASKVVSGSCRVVEHILGLSSVRSIQALVAKECRPGEEVPVVGPRDGTSRLFLAPRLPTRSAAASAPVVFTPRVGLSLKRAVVGSHEQ